MSESPREAASAAVGGGSAAESVERTALGPALLKSADRYQVVTKVKRTAAMCFMVAGHTSQRLQRHPPFLNVDVLLRPNPRSAIHKPPMSRGKPITMQGWDVVRSLNFHTAQERKHFAVSLPSCTSVTPAWQKLCAAGAVSQPATVGGLGGEGFRRAPGHTIRSQSRRRRRADRRRAVRDPPQR